MNEKYVPSSWAAVDAVQVLGTSLPPTERVWNSQNEIIYVPRKGIEAVHADQEFDAVEFDVSNCALTSSSPGRVSIYFDSSLTGTAAGTSGSTGQSLSLLSISSSSSVFYTQSAPVALSTSNIADMALAIPIDTSAIIADFTSVFSTSTSSSSFLVSISSVAVNSITCIGDSGSVNFADSAAGAGSQSSITSFPFTLKGTTPSLSVTLPIEPQTCTVLLSLTVNVTSLTSSSPLRAPVQYSQALLLTSSYPNSAQIYHQPSSYYSAFLAIFIICMFLCLLATILVLIAWYTRHRVIRAASPVFLLTMLTGGFFLYSTIPSILVYPPTSASCTASIWLGHLGFGLLFGSLFAKTFRVAKIFDTKELKVKRISDASLGVRVAGLVGLITVFLVVWSAVGPPLPHYISANDSSSGVASLYCICDSSAAWSSILVSLEGLLVLYGAYLCWSTRHTPTLFDESKFIALSLYNLMFCGSVVFAISAAALSSPVVSQAFQMGGILVVTTVSLALILIPKLLMIRNGGGNETTGFTQGPKTRTGVGAANSSGGPNASSVGESAGGKEKGSSSGQPNKNGTTTALISSMAGSVSRPVLSSPNTGNGREKPAVNNFLSSSGSVSVSVPAPTSASVRPSRPQIRDVTSSSIKETRAEEGTGIGEETNQVENGERRKMTDSISLVDLDGTEAEIK